MWQVEDLIRDYAAQIEDHVNRLVNLVEQNHWRRNPRVLVHYRIALFRKNASPLPSIIYG